MRYIVQTVPGSPYLSYLQARIPGLDVVTDLTGNAMDTYLASLIRQGADSAVHLEDDIILTKDFEAKIEMVIRHRRASVVQCFSMRKADLTEKSRWDRTFSMNQCTYLPAGYAPLILAYAQHWCALHPEHPTGYDLLLHDWLRSRKEPHWISVPSLVQHRIGPSRIGPRSSKRQSLTFTDPDL
jgi:hypothetical protein